MYNKVISIVAVCSMFLIGCGGTDYHTIVVKEVQAPVEETIEGLVYFTEESSGEVSGALGITIDYQGRIDVEEVETFRSTNFNGSFGTHPRVGFSNVTELQDGLIIFAGDINYSANNDLEEDGSTSNLSAGRHYTVYTLSMDESGSLLFKIQIHDGNTSSSGGINDIVIERVFKEL